MSRIFKKIVLLVFLFPSLVWANEQPGVWIDLPVYEYPFNNSTDNVPSYFSMRQSMAVSTGFLQTAHRIIGGDIETERDGLIWRYSLIVGFDLLTSATPLGSGWAHEEWHRAVMTRRDIGSYNDMNNFPIGENIIAVSHVLDDDLARLKANHPAEHIRMSTAGMEAQIYQNLYIEKSHFFRGARSQDGPLLWINAFGVSGYMATCASTAADKETEKQMDKEGANVDPRDFTGLDCTAWVYDLHRPDEPYANRGTHPSGVGIRRYIKYSDLTSEEKDYLKKHAALSFLNFVDPFLIGFKQFTSGDVRWNTKLSHTMTSFGAVVNGHLFLDTGSSNYLLTLHSGMAKSSKTFPGLTVEMIDKPITDKFLLSVSGTAWNQPKNQRFDTRAEELLLSAKAELAYKFKEDLRYYLGVEHKNDGWLTGNVYLDENTSVWTGLRYGIFK